MYDAVFKHLLEDEESARLIVGTILGEQIDEIELAPQEITAQNVTLAQIDVQRLDFAATVRTADGERLRVLIEVQKSHYSEDVLRFRRYLGQHYAEHGYVTVGEKDGGRERRRALPLLTIYFLGRRLPKTGATVLKVARRYLDAVTGEELPQREDFVEALTHDCYVVQVPLLTDERRNDLEKLLSIFDQRLQTEDRHVLDLDHMGMPPQYAPVLRRLEAAAADTAVAASMALADEVTSIWVRQEETIAEREETIAEREETIAEHEETIRRQKAEIDALHRRIRGPGDG